MRPVTTTLLTADSPLSPNGDRVRTPVAVRPTGTRRICAGMTSLRTKQEADSAFTPLRMLLRSDKAPAGNAVTSDRKQQQEECNVSYNTCHKHRVFSRFRYLFCIWLFIYPRVHHALFYYFPAVVDVYPAFFRPGHLAALKVVPAFGPGLGACLHSADASGIFL